MTKHKPAFYFRKLDCIGAADAEGDERYLSTCFVDTGDIEILRDCADTRRIVVGRTGSGKTALLQRLIDREERAIVVPPESLALSYVSNSTILQFLSALDVKLDIFFRLLWRHVFTVEILRHHSKIDSEAKKKTFFQVVRGIFGEKKHEQTLKYLDRWGKSFWEETDYRIRELTTTLESNVKAEIGVKLNPMMASVQSGQKLSEQQKAEVAHRAQAVVNKVQIKELTEILDLLDGLLQEDQQHRYFVVVDRLDENWVEDRLRYSLIRALIETVRDFRRVRQVKIVIALRIDLLDRVFRLTRDAGFQEEKYHSLYLPLSWTRPHLVELIDKRIDALVKSRYTKQPISAGDLLPGSIDNANPLDYLITRTFYRPRDVILFLNQCIAFATDESRLSAPMLKRAEGAYSNDRLHSLQDEWRADFPFLLEFAALLKGMPSGFAVARIHEGKVSDLCLEFTASKTDSAEDVLSATASQIAYGVISPRLFRQVALHVFYRVGLVGLKPDAHQPVSWSDRGTASFGSEDIQDEWHVAIHPMFWRALGVKSP
jgi:hypothetical protein